MEKGFTVNEIAGLMKVSHTTIYRKVKHLKNSLKPHQYKKGQIIYFTQTGFEIIKESVIDSNPNIKEEFNPVKHCSTPDNELLDTLKKQLEEYKKIIAEKEDKISLYQNLITQKDNILSDIQFANIEERKRTDTIIMSLTNRIEDFQNKMITNKKPGVIKRFLNWITAPDEKKEDEEYNWQNDERFAR